MTSSLAVNLGPTPPHTPCGSFDGVPYRPSPATVEPYVAGHEVNQKLDQLLLFFHEQKAQTAKMEDEIQSLRKEVVTIQKQQEEKTSAEASISVKKERLPKDLSVSV